MNPENYRSLTKEEIKALPLDLRICYFLQPWNISASIHSVEEWIDSFLWLWACDDEGGIFTKEALEDQAKTRMFGEFTDIKTLLLSLEEEGRIFMEGKGLFIPAEGHQKELKNYIDRRRTRGEKE